MYKCTNVCSRPEDGLRCRLGVNPLLKLKLFLLVIGDLVETQKIGHVYMVGINRLEVKNCVDPSTASQLLYAFKEFERQEDLWVAVLYGKGK